MTVALRALNELDLLEEALRRTRKTHVLEETVPAFQAQLETIFATQALHVLTGLRRGELLAEAWVDPDDWDAWMSSWDDYVDYQGPVPSPSFVMRLLEQAQWRTKADMLHHHKTASSEALAKGVAKGKFDFNAEFSLDDPAAQAWLNANGAWMVQNVDDATRNMLRETLVHGREQGWSYARIAKRFTEQFRYMAEPRPQEHIRNRAELIAVNELAKAYEAGTRLVVDQLGEQGLELEKSWLAVHDDRVDIHCAHYEAMGWIPVNEAFDGPSIQQPPAHPGCRCTSVYRRKGALYESFLVPLGEHLPGQHDQLSHAGGFSGRGQMPIEAVRRCQKLARIAVRNAPQPTPEEVAEAKRKYSTPGGARLAERNARGGTKDRKARRAFVLKTFGDGEHCPCVNCGERLDDSTVTIDRIIPGEVGGKYIRPNIIPACSGCNKGRGSTPIKKLMKYWKA